MASLVGSGLNSAVFGAEKCVLFGVSTTMGPAAVVFPAKLGRSFGGVVACAPAAQSTRKARGITKPRPISPELQDLVGASEISRTQAVKLIWNHIKANNLQDPNNKKIIICDEKLKKIFAGKDSVGFLEISGLISPHLL
ncbi:hypothetical protein RND81_11G215100 [Saponaria officinalis]|uniref:DM2 domain-containing protein n=1 Tax=Saponaria officinalis TaxID=3572 RepID=A0AAW1HP34_SAPOF